MKWLKLYNEARTDNKFMCLTLAERGVWVNLLCYANEQAERGTFDASDRFQLSWECAAGDEAALNSTIEKLVRIRHLVPGTSEGHFTFRTWTTRQARKPSDEPAASAERKRAERERKRVFAHSDTVDPSRAVTRDTGVTGDVSRRVSRKKGNVTRLESRYKREDNSSPDSVVNDDGYPLSLAAADAGGGSEGEHQSLNGLHPVAAAGSDTAPGIHANGNGHLALADVAPTPPGTAAPPSPPPAETAPDPPVAQRAAAMSRRVDPIWEVLCEVIPGKPPVTQPERSRRGKVVSELKKIGATPDDVRRHAERYVQRYGADKLTDTALVNRWSECDPDEPLPLPRAPYSAAPAGGPSSHFRTAAEAAVPVDKWM